MAHTPGARSMTGTASATGPSGPSAGLLSILHVPGCPHLGRVRASVREALAVVGVSAAVEELVGPYPSPTVLVVGVDVAGQPLGMGPSCRLDLPTTDQIAAAILAAGAESTGLEDAP